MGWRGCGYRDKGVNRCEVRGWVRGVRWAGMGKRG